MIELHKLTKTYGHRTVVDTLSFHVRAGVVTGFLGPNGAGKSTTMRMILGLDTPTSGTALIQGRPYTEHRAPLHQVGALLEARAVHPGRTARNHLRWIADTAGISRARVDEVLELAGIAPVADRRVGGFSLGMGQRLGVATALLGDPAVVILDEPVNGLDPDGVLWIRTLARSLADQGRTVLISSHLMSEMALTADHLIVIGRGRLIADLPTADLLAHAGGGTVQVRTPAPARLGAVLNRPGVTISATRACDVMHISGLSAAAIGDAALRAGIPLHELAPRQASLEEAFMRLTRDSLDYRTDPVETS